MSYARGKINLAQFQHMKTSVPSADGKSKIEGVFIPFELNHIFVSEKGNFFIDFNTKDKPENFKGDFTHFMKQSVDKTTYQSMKEKGVYPPDFGTMEIAAGGGGGEPSPNTDFPPIGSPDNGSPLEVNTDDLPF